MRFIDCEIFHTEGLRVYSSVENPIAIKKYFRVRAGITQLTDTLAGVNVSLSSVTIHPQFDQNTMDFDVSIVRLVHNIPLDDYQMRAIKLPSDDFEMPYGQLAEVTGWGRLEVIALHFTFHI